MFGFGKKSSGFDENFDPDAVVSRYEGEVVIGDYVAENLNRKTVDGISEPYHLMIPEGEGKLTYLHHGEVIEEYEGEFSGGQYHCGARKLIWRFFKLIASLARNTAAHIKLYVCITLYAL